ncbi:hypothetical protein [Nocardia wallacei]|uniref:hypothetical protein n=1 Tax=Nocardia wallacei TaxID=480035 RepID=UPI002454F312|nr:hypothetical protein [Nocardia wallacei]
MKYFETRYGAGTGQERLPIRPEKEALWAAAFGVDNLAYIFDLDTPATAIPKIDAAIARFNHAPESLRPLLPPGEPGGLVRSRRVLEQLRATLADHEDASISGAMEDEGVPPTP